MCKNNNVKDECLIQTKKVPLYAKKEFAMVFSGANMRIDGVSGF